MAQVQQSETESTQLNGSHQVVQQMTDQDGQANFMITSYFKGKPIHEKMAIAAILSSKLAASFGSTQHNTEPPIKREVAGGIEVTEYAELENLSNEQWDYIRGVVWNDDPRCLLFNDDPNNNHVKGLGVEWYQDFELGPVYSMTQRSHNGDMQFLHSMASEVGERPGETRARLQLWIEAMYLTWAGKYNASTPLKDTNLAKFFMKSKSEWLDAQNQAKSRDVLTTMKDAANTIIKKAEEGLKDTAKSIDDTIKELKEPTQIVIKIVENPFDAIGSLFSRKMATGSAIQAKNLSGTASGVLSRAGGQNNGLIDLSIDMLKAAQAGDPSIILTGDSTMHDLLLGSTTAYKANLAARALGSALHAVQDSYSRGHTKRQDDFQAVLRFHCYTGQDHTKHGHYDEEGGDNLDTHNIDSFRNVQGGVPAIRSCISLINAFVDNGALHRSFTDGGDQSVSSVFQQIWTLGSESSGLGPADSDV